MNFKDTLASLPGIEHLAALHLVDVASGERIATLEHKPGQAGSLAVYAALAARHGGEINAQAAAEGLVLYAEHTADARARPGAHPNIDRLLALVSSAMRYRVELVPR